MKIAINATLIDHYSRSGLQVYLDNLLKGLALVDKNNKYTLLFTSLRRHACEMRGPTTGNFSKKVLLYPDTRFPYKNQIFNRIFLPIFLKNNSFDLYHAPAGYYLPNENKIKKILTIHDLRSLRISDKTYPQNITALRKAANRADVCITVSECTKNDVIELLGVKKEKIKVTYLGVDDNFKPIEEKDCGGIRKKYGLDGKFIFSLGQVPRKNVERLIKAFKEFKYNDEFLLVIGGAGNEGPWISKYNKLIQNLQLNDRVKLIGYVPYEELPLLYNSCEFFVFPSLYEGFGIPILEAMSCGTAVITSNVSSLPEIGKDAVLYVDPYDEEDISNKMQNLTENHQLKDSFIKKGLLRAKEFSWQKMAQDTLRIYEEQIIC